MRRYSRSAPVLPRVGVLIALALLCTGSSANAQWRRVQVIDPAFSVEVPEDWTVREVQGRGARLLAPDDAIVVEVVAWSALWPPATPEKAAAEHEGVLSRMAGYRRDGVEQIVTDAGASALVVSGRARAQTLTEASIFAAYGADGRHYVLGLFCEQARLAELRASLLDRMMRSFIPGVAPVEPEPEPEPPVEPPVDPEPAVESAGEPVLAETEAAAPSALQVNGHGEPLLPEPPGTIVAIPAPAEAVTPEPVTPEPVTPWAQHVDPAGFSVWVPAGWAVGVREGLIVIRPAAEDGSRLASLWPVTGADPGAEAALRLALTRLPELRLARVDPLEELDGATLITGATTGGARLVATWSYEDGMGLLQLAAAPEEAWESDLPVMARILSSFRAGQWPVAYQREVEVTDDRGLLAWTLPEGWQVRGGARIEAGDVGIAIEALGPGDEAPRVGWEQPMHPHFRALTPLLESLGWREGERYSVPEGGGGLLIYRHREPQQLVRDMLLPRHSRELRLTAIDSEPPDAGIAGLLFDPDAVGQVVTVKGGSAIGPRERLYLAASARADGPLATTCWDAAALRADAAEGRLPASVAVLAEMVRSARVTEKASAADAQRLQELIGRAQRAIRAIPEELRPAPGAGLASVLGAEPVAGGGIWLPPRGATAGGWWSERSPADPPAGG